MRFLKFLFVVVLVAALFAVSGCKKKKEIKRKPPGVVVAPVIKEDVTASFRHVGQTIAYDDVSLVARVQGTLEKKNFKDGAYVKKGQLLFVIEKDQYQAAVAAAKANLAQAQAQLTKANIDYKRNKGLFEKNAVSQKDFDDATCEKSSAEAQVLASKANLQQAELDLGYTEIKAPFDGKLGAATYSVGNIVNQNSGTLVDIVSLNPIKVEFSVSEKILISHLQKRQTQINTQAEKDTGVIPWLVLSNGTEYKYPGEIIFLDNKVNPSTGTVAMRAKFPNDEFILMPGQYVKVILRTKEKTAAILVNAAAVQEDQGGKFVLVVGKDNKVESRRIVAPRLYGINYAVKEGLKEGEKVIVEGLQKVRPGMVVAPVLDKGHSSSDKGDSSSGEQNKKNQE